MGVAPVPGVIVAARGPLRRPVGAVVVGVVGLRPRADTTAPRGPQRPPRRAARVAAKVARRVGQRRVVRVQRRVVLGRGVQRRVVRVQRRVVPGRVAVVQGRVAEDRVVARAGARRVVARAADAAADAADGAVEEKLRGRNECR